MRQTLALLLVLLLLGSSAAAPVFGRTQIETPVTSPAAVPASGATPAATPLAASLAGVAPQPLTGQRRAEFEAYVAAKVAESGVPGAAVAVVQGGEVVYARGFGVRQAGGIEPVTADTLMMIGSVTKSMTSLMAATLVDDGRLAWETPVRDLLPAFAVADPAQSERLTIADAFCMCTGIPRRDIYLFFNSDGVTPEALIASVAQLPLTAAAGETFQYSNQMYAVGGYAAAVAAGATPADLLAGYGTAMRDRVLGPIGMTRSTFALDEALASGDYADPYGIDFAGQPVPLPVAADASFVAPVAPAGALWSSANDMARYLQTELAGGVAPDGTRVVSAENLARTWRPGVAIPPPAEAPTFLNEANANYGLGWVTGTYQGLSLVHHSGGTFGFVSQVVLVPEADLGVVVLTNGLAGSFLAQGVPFRLLEILFDQPAEIDAVIAERWAAAAEQFGQLETGLVPADADAVAPFLGRYVHPALGTIELSLRDGRLVFDAGEIVSALAGLRDPATGEVSAYLFTDPPLNIGEAVVLLQQGGGGVPQVVLQVQGEGEETYVFVPADAPTPP